MSHAKSGVHRRRFLSAFAGTAAMTAMSGWSLFADDPPPVTNPRATDGDERFEPNWDERLTVSVGQKSGDMIAFCSKVRINGIRRQVSIANAGPPLRSIKVGGPALRLSHPTRIHNVTAKIARPLRNYGHQTHGSEAGISANTASQHGSRDSSLALYRTLRRHAEMRRHRHRRNAVVLHMGRDC